MSDCDDLCLSGAQTIDDRKRKTPEQESTCAVSMSRPPLRRAPDLLDSPVEFRDECSGSRVAALAVPGLCSCRLREGSRMKSDG